MKVRASVKKVCEVQDRSPQRRCAVICENPVTSSDKARTSDFPRRASRPSVGNEKEDSEWLASQA